MKILFTIFTLFISNLVISNLAQAHYLWLEKADTNTANLYFGEWHNNRIENSEKLTKFSDAKLFNDDIESAPSLTLHETYFSTLINTKNDVLMSLVTMPAKANRAKKIFKTSYYAKIGRNETRAKLALELVPTNKHGDTFTLIFNGKPLLKNEVIVYGPPKWEKNYKTNNQGEITIETPWHGQYIIRTSHKVLTESGTSTLENPNQRYVFTNTFYVNK